MDKGIGTYKERTLHSVLKNYLEPDADKQEIKYKKFICDIKNEQGITEIQTRSFNAMRHKLDAFLQEDVVTIVYPLVRTKWLLWVDVKSGEITKKRKSPKTGTVFESFNEFYKIKFYLTHPNLRLKIIEVDVEEYRLLNGWSDDRKKGSTRCERIPVNIGKIIDIASTSDFILLLPETLTDVFTSRDFSKAAHINLSSAQTALNVLAFVGAVIDQGKNGRYKLYARSSGEEQIDNNILSNDKI